MLVLQAIPARDVDAYKLLRGRIREASTWTWGNKARTRLRHVQRPKGGHIRISDAGGVLVAHVHPATPRDQFYLAEKFMGRLIAWFEGDLLAINIQFVPEPEKGKRPKRKPVKRKPVKRRRVTRKRVKRKRVKRTKRKGARRARKKRR